MIVVTSGLLASSEEAHLMDSGSFSDPQFGKSCVETSVFLFHIFSFKHGRG